MAHSPELAMEPMEPMVGVEVVAQVAVLLTQSLVMAVRVLQTLYGAEVTVLGVVVVREAMQSSLRLTLMEWVAQVDNTVVVVVVAMKVLLLEALGVKDLLLLHMIPS